MKLATLFCLLLLLAFCESNRLIGPEIQGVRLGMNKETVHQRLQNTAEIENQLNKQQEVWRLKSDPHYSHLIVAYNKEYTSVRFITAIAKDDGQRVRYADVIDTAKATKTESGNNVTYTIENNEAGENFGFLVKAIGNDPQYLKYYSVKLTGEGAGNYEEEEDE